MTLMISILLLSANAVADIVNSGNKIQIAAGTSLQGHQLLAKNELRPVKSDIYSAKTRWLGHGTTISQKRESGLEKGTFMGRRPQLSLILFVQVWD